MRIQAAKAADHSRSGADEQKDAIDLVGRAGRRAGRRTAAPPGLTNAHADARRAGQGRRRVWPRRGFAQQAFKKSMMITVSTKGSTTSTPIKRRTTPRVRAWVAAALVGARLLLAGSAEEGALRRFRSAAREVADEVHEAQQVVLLPVVKPLDDLPDRIDEVRAVALDDDHGPLPARSHLPPCRRITASPR